MGSKEVLLKVLGRLLMREVFEDDVIYDSEMVPSGFRGTVLLLCLGGVPFQGPIRSRAEEAESAAANVCLQAFAAAGKLAIPDTAALVVPKPKATAVAPGQKRPAEPKPPAFAPPPEVLWAAKVGSSLHSSAVRFAGGEAPAKRLKVVGMQPVQKPNDVAVAQEMDSKSQLYRLLQEIAGKPMSKAELEFNISAVHGGSFQATVTLHTFDGQGFAGAACTKKKDAEQSVSAVALSWLKDNFPSASAVIAPSAANRKRAQSAPPGPAGVVAPRSVAQNGQGLKRSASWGSLQAEGRSSAPDFCSEWRDHRLDNSSEGDVADPSSMDFYYGQVCLLCQSIVGARGWEAHANGKKHLQRFQNQPMKLRLGIERPPTGPGIDLLPPEAFAETGGWALQDQDGQFPSVLTLGEMDFSFSLAVAKRRPSETPLVATSYLGKHDPREVEVHPADDGERAAFTRRSLPGMKGDLARNICELEKLGAQVRHSVDATNLDRTLRSQGIDGGFHVVIFPFPRASLSRAPNPGNSRLLREFFFSTVRDGFLLQGGLVQLVMLTTQYEDWDVNGMAADAGLALSSRAALPDDFYQAREMSGKPWTPGGAELLTFEVVSG